MGDSNPSGSLSNTKDEINLQNVKKSLQIVCYGLPLNLNKKQFHKFLTHALQIRKVDVELIQV